MTTAPKRFFPSVRNAPPMARIARGIGTFLLIPGVILVVAGLLASAIGYFAMDGAMADHRDPTLFSTGNDRETHDRAELGAMVAIAGLVAAGAGAILATVGGTVRAFSDDGKPAQVVN